MKKIDSFSQLRKKFLSSIVLLSLCTTITPIFLEVNATVIDSGNTILGQNGNTVNITNSSTYDVSFALNGTLDIGNTIVVTAKDSLGKTLSNSYVSSSGGESTGSIVMNFNTSGWTDGILSYSGVIYSGNTSTPIVASGMNLSGKIDKTHPVMTLVGAPTMTISQ